MLEIFLRIFSDVNFLGAFIQTVVLIFLGFILKRKNVFNDGAKAVLTTLVWKITVPCFAFNAFMQDFNQQIFSKGVQIFYISIVFYILLIFAGKFSFIRLSKSQSTLAGLFFAIGQTTLFSMPVLQSVYDSKAGYSEVMLYISILSIVFRIFVYIVGFTLISGEKLTENTLLKLKQIFVTPVMIGMISGIICFLIQNKLPFVRLDRSLPQVYFTVKSLARMLNPCAMLLIGVTLGEADFQSAFKSGLAWIFAILRNVICPVIVTALCVLLHKIQFIQFNEYSLIAVVIAFSAPISVSLSVICVQYNKDQLLASRSVLVSTLLTIITLPMAFVLAHFAVDFLL